MKFRHQILNLDLVTPAAVECVQSHLHVTLPIDVPQAALRRDETLLSNPVGWREIHLTEK